MRIILPNLDEVQPWLKWPILPVGEPENQQEGSLRFIGGANATPPMLVNALKGGPGSGFHGHAGRPGERGGSQKERGAATPPTQAEIDRQNEDQQDYLASQRYESDPVVRAWLGGTMAEDEGHAAALRLAERAPLFKNRVVTGLQSIGLSYDDANLFIRSWANSANEGYVAQMIQKAAADEFGTPYHAYQQGLLNQANAEWERDWQRQIDYVNLFEEVDAETAEILKTQALRDLPFPDLAKKRFAELFPDGLRTDVGSKPSVSDVVAIQKHIEQGVRQLRAEQEALTRTALRSIYTNTQKDLAEQGIDELILYRGFAAEQSSADLGDTLNITSNALSSWSADLGVANSFARSGAAGLVFAIKVKADRVFSTPRTGFGCLGEWEFVLLGNDADSATVANIFDEGKKRERSTKSKEFTMQIIQLDDSDANADWIKLANPEATAFDRAIHAKLASTAEWPQVDTDSAEEWPDVSDDLVDDTVAEA